MQPILNIENVSKLYHIHDPVSGARQPFWSLKEVSFSMQRGICTGLLGANGSGKSTLLKIISRITMPTSGKVSVHGSLAPLLGFDGGFHDELTGMENAYIYASLIGIKRRELQHKLSDILDFADLGPFLDTKIRFYSRGMRLRLAFSIASHANPDLILADEILAVGDEDFKQQCMQRILDLKASGTSILLVQHDSKVINALCDNSISLEKGRLISDKSSARIV